MRYFLDAEFVDDGRTIMPISLALAAETGDDFYVEFEFDEKKAQAHDFVRKNVLPHLQGPRMPREEAREALLEFVDEEPVFWGWYASYDWVLVCQLFGSMVGLPEHFPWFVRDLRQVVEELRVPESVLPPDPEGLHNALVDAQWTREAFGAVQGYLARGGSHGGV